MLINNVGGTGPLVEAKDYTAGDATAVLLSNVVAGTSASARCWRRRRSRSP
ncbi:hypothetical protein [Streptomyces spiralis]|uniref:hypothetical protein n=1 Tax=Streptomyces spiralis TaxID=66376 RepID=UPI0033CB1B4B